MIEKSFEGKSYEIIYKCRSYIAESMGIEKNYNVTIRIEELISEND